VTATRPAGVEDERVVRAAAGITMVVGATAFGYAYFDHEYVPLQVVTACFLADFLVRVTLGLRVSPAGLLARAMTRGHAPDWVPAAPKRFAWTLGLVMSLAMTVITNSGIRGTLPRTICLLCLTLMWMESVLGVCVGCKLAGLLARRGWRREDQACADGACRVPDARVAAPRAS
jgi:Domain of unknown function (DUF4395)